MQTTPRIFRFCEKDKKVRLPRAVNNFFFKPTIFCVIRDIRHIILWITLVPESILMTKSLKKPEFLYPFAKLFTRGTEDAYDQIPFQSSESFGDESAPILAAPTQWGFEAVAVMAQAAFQSIPAVLKAVEENTVPSWLWRHHGQSTRQVTEGDMRDIFNRVVGSAAAKAWKLDLFTSEKHARAFYDEARYALMQRHIAILPEILISMGVSWAYGRETIEPLSSGKKTLPQAQLSNAEIDAVLSKTKDAALWKKLFALPGKELSTVSLRLNDIATDWYSVSPNPARAAIDVMALRHNDGSINCDALKQTARILTLLLDLHDRCDVTISLANLAPLLVALGLPYDSDAGRAMAASLTAMVTAECICASAEMAALRGASDAFSTNRDAIMRSLRNHRRAAYGDGNDYEKLSVLPAPLPLKNCPDLALAADAQRSWDDAVTAAHAFGLRATHATDLTPSVVLSALMDGASQGLEPMPSLTLLQQDGADHHQTVLHPAVGEALVRLDYPRHIASGIAQHIVGTHSLMRAPIINHSTLRARGLNDTALEKIESYLPCVDTIRLALTPWIIGIDFCQTQLKILPRTLQAPRFDLLKHLGFSDTEIADANIYCYGYGTVRNAKILHLRHRALFACGTEISTEARLRMAASVQSFVSGDTGIVASLPATQSVTRGAEVTLAAWQSGLKSVTLIFDPAIEAKPVRGFVSTTRRIKAASQPHAKSFKAPQRLSRSGKTAPVLSAKKSRAAHKAH